jgi:hypothetical protein
MLIDLKLHAVLGSSIAVAVRVNGDRRGDDLRQFDFVQLPQSDQGADHIRGAVDVQPDRAEPGAGLYTVTWWLS